MAVAVFILYVLVTAPDKRVPPMVEAAELEYHWYVKFSPVASTASGTGVAPLQ